MKKNRLKLKEKRRARGRQSPQKVAPHRKHTKEVLRQKKLSRSLVAYVPPPIARCMPISYFTNTLDIEHNANSIFKGNDRKTKRDHRLCPPCWNISHKHASHHFFIKHKSIGCFHQIVGDNTGNSIKQNT